MNPKPQQAFPEALVVQAARFVIVVAFGAAINFAVTIALTEALGLPYWVSLAFGIGAASASNFFLKRVWVFPGSTYHPLQFVKFAMVGGLGVVINYGVTLSLTELAGLPYQVSIVFGTALAIISNFFGHRHFTFAR